jgi:hypothetical protein
VDVPYLSIVVAGRNDGHGGDFTGRLICFCKTTGFLAEKNRCTIEIIVVEWNPPHDAPCLADAVAPAIEGSRFVSIRIVTVPPAVHNEVAGGSGLPLLEWYAKNCGALRAGGEYILVTNPDIVFSEDLFAFLSERKLTKNAFYRAVRKDVLYPEDARTMRPEEIVAHCDKSILCEHGPSGAHTASRQGAMDRIMRVVRFIMRKTLPNYRLYTNAAGDFLCTHKDNFVAACGYPEWNCASFVDGYICYLLANGPLDEYVLPPACCVYHLDHARPKKAGLLRYRLDLLRIILLHIARINDPRTWGLQNYSLQERLL